MFKRSMISTGVAAAIAFASQPLMAQAPADDSQLLEEVVVTGIRSSLNRAIDIKRDSMQVMDSIVAEDIGKLPDNNVVESLQRVSGIQVTDRGSGEANQVSLRGLTDVSTTVNGRTIFTSSGRAVALADIPSTLVSRVDVIKSRSASNYENGIAGQIDIHTARPFDFDGSHATISGRLVHQDEADKTDPILSGLASHRWSTDAGDFGALINVSHATTNYRDQSITAGAQFPFFTENPPDGFDPLEQMGDVIGGEQVWEPGTDRGLPTEAGSTLNVNGEPTEYYLARDAIFASDLTGERERQAANISLQFAPNDRSEYTFEAFYNGYRNDSFNALHFAFVNHHGDIPGDVEDSFELVEGTNVVRERTIGNGFTFGSGDYTKSKTDSYVYALGGEWEITPDFNLRSELVYQESDFEDEFIALRTTNVRHQTTANFNAVPGVSFANNPDTEADERDLTDVSQYDMAEMYNNAVAHSGDAFTFTADAEYFTNWDFLHTLNFGVRYDDRDATEFGRDQDAPPCGESNTTGDPANCDFESYPGISHVNSGFMSGVADVPRSWMVADGPYLQSNRNEMLGLYGLDPNQALLEEFSVGEENVALYVTGDFETQVAGRLLDGELGFRYVDVTTDTAFTDQVTEEQTFGTTDNSELLTNLMMRYHFTDELMLRLSYGETLRMPGFGDLNPTINYFDDVTDIGYGTAEGGNPDLQPTTSQNLDLSLEWYFGDASSAYVTLFQRDIEGLVVPFRNVVEQDIEGFDVNTFIVSQPDNASEGTLEGVEIGLTYFPENLPGYWDGLGVQASVTALDSEQTLPIVDEEGVIVDSDTSPMFGVSDLSYSVSVAYERPTFDARLSYIWRDNFLHENEAAQFANPLGIYRDSEQSLDFQFSYNATDNLVVTFDATNLTDEVFQSRYGGSDLHAFGSSVYSRTFALGARYTF